MRQMGGAVDYTPGRAASGLEATRQRAVHTLDTPTGGLPQDPEWGRSLADMIGVGLDDGDLRTAAALFREAFRRDPEIQDADVTIELLGPNESGQQQARFTAVLTTMLGNTTVETTVTAT